MSHASAKTRVDVRILDPRITDREAGRDQLGGAGRENQRRVDAGAQVAPGSTCAPASTRRWFSRPAPPS